MMSELDLKGSFAGLTTPLVADACMRAGVELRVAPFGVRPLAPAMRAAGRVLPAEHAGSVDVFIEAVRGAEAGDVLVVGNRGRLDEACVGDLTVLELMWAGLAGLVVWGAHRDTDELLELGFPVFSYGPLPAGPRRLDPREPDALERARFGDFTVGRGDAVFADSDGVLFVPLERAGEVLRVASAIRDTERRQAESLKAGVSLGTQLRFGEFLEARAKDPSLTFREHLRRTGGEVEE